MKKICTLLILFMLINILMACQNVYEHIEYFENHYPAIASVKDNYCYEMFEKELYSPTIYPVQEIEEYLVENSENIIIMSSSGFTTYICDTILPSSPLHCLCLG